MRHDVNHHGTVTHNVVHHFPADQPDPGEAEQLDRIENAINALESRVSDLSVAVDAVIAAEGDEDAQAAANLAAKDAIIAALQEQLAATQAQRDEALANDAVDAQVIADLQAADAEQDADTAAQIARLNETFGTGVVTPPEEPPVEPPPDA